METIEEKNRMIAEFMGFKPEKTVVNVAQPSGYTKAKNVIAYQVEAKRTDGITNLTHDYMLKYHTSWDWLMPVVIYINVNTEHTFVIQAMDCYVYNVNNGKQVTQPSMKYQPSELINSVYETVIEFIEMYNQKN